MGLDWVFVEKFPKLLALYAIEKLIGKGGQGRVFLVRRRADGELLACKTVKAGEEAAWEAQSLRRMQGSPSVVALHEVIHDRGSEGAHDHLVLELCDCTLRDRVERAGVPMVEAEAAYLMKSLAKGVQDLHSRGILHRDIKQDNVLLTSAYELKICDLGVSADFTRGSYLKTNKVSGTPRYLAPEATLGSYSEAVDVWGLGLILYEVLSGVLAFSSLSSQAVVEKLKAGADIAETLEWSKVSAGAKGLILQMLKKDPKERLTMEVLIEHPWIAQFDQESKFDTKKRKGDDSDTVLEEPVQNKKPRKMNHLNGTCCIVKPCAVAPVAG